MNDGELLHIANQKGDLVPEAKVALEEEIASRNLSIGQEHGRSAREEEKAESTESKSSGFGRAALEILVFFIISFALAAVVSQFVGSNNRAQEALGQLSVYFAMLLWGIYRTLAGFRYREIWVAAVGITLVLIFLGPMLKRHQDRKALFVEWQHDLAELQQKKAPIINAIREAYSEDASTWEGYERRLSKLEPVLPEWEKQLGANEKILEKFAASPFASDQYFMKILSNGQRILELDVEFTRLLRQEVALGRALLKLPANARDKFWDDNLASLQIRQNDISSEQVRIVNEVLELMQRTQ